MSDLRESGSIEQDADIVMMLYREDYYKDENPPEEANANITEVIVAKNRHGPVETVELGWNPDYTMFTTLERNRDEM